MLGLCELCAQGLWHPTEAPVLWWVQLPPGTHSGGRQMPAPLSALLSIMVPAWALPAGNQPLDSSALQEGSSPLPGHFKMLGALPGLFTTVVAGEELGPWCS